MQGTVALFVLLQFSYGKFLTKIDFFILFQKLIVGFWKVEL